MTESWTHDERKVVYSYVGKCFSEMVRVGCFRRVKTGNYAGNYECLRAPHAEASSQLTLALEDDALPPAPRISIVVSRILRDTPVATALKELYEDCCQVCGIALHIREQNYSEAHHLRPLGMPHNGPDNSGNMMVLCPNHHVLFDYGIPVWQDKDVVEIEGITFVLKLRHVIDMRNISYYKQHLQLKSGL